MFEQVKNIELCSCLLTLLGQWLSIAAYEKRLWDIDNFLVNKINGKNDVDFENSPFIVVYLCYNMFVTMALTFSVYSRYETWLKYRKSLGKFDQSDTLYNTGYYKEMMPEILLILLSPYPFLNRIKYTEVISDWDNFEIVYEINDVLLLFSFIRVYIIVRYILFNTGFLDGRSQRICK